MNVLSLPLGPVRRRHFSYSQGYFHLCCASGDYWLYHLRCCSGSARDGSDDANYIGPELNNAAVTLTVPNKLSDASGGA